MDVPVGRLIWCNRDEARVCISIRLLGRFDKDREGCACAIYLLKPAVEERQRNAQSKGAEEENRGAAVGRSDWSSSSALPE